MISYGLVVQIAGLSEWEDKHILDLAFVAHEQFLTQFAKDDNAKRYKSPSLSAKDKPRVTTTMVVDNTAYIATSLKGKGAYIYDLSKSDIKGNHPCEGPVLEGLRRCQQRSIDLDNTTQMHRTKAKCGEYMAALAFCIDTRQQRELSDAKIVSIFAKSPTENVLIPPCDKTSSGEKGVWNEWGCNEFTQDVKMHVITDKDGREAKDVADEDIQQPSEQTRYP
ncbi:hypothetical protein M436DRAFT_79324 [Aureobasidium namibiae CBS 147.97]|uniref:Uncharacterized protein n=1 Tax=Aureobasidium namibiae CBS 147.97 TaxID=1043004 RepID=A0A074X206_9PEZI